MNRKEFIKKSLAVGISLPFLNLVLQSCSKDEGIDFPEFDTDFTGKVLIVGAGAAGLAAGYLLERYGVDFEIIEAGSNYGGRMKRDTGLANFPIDLGAEWIHESPSVLADLINNPSIDASVDFIVYNPQSIKTYNNGKLRNLNIGSNYYSEYKFKSTTWFGFYEQYIVPSIQDKIRLNSPISQIDYAGDKVIATSTNNTTYEADKVLVTAPINVLQSDIISFTPELPLAKTDAINSVIMGDGIKVFIEFSKKFYPDILLFGSLTSAFNRADDKLYYDAAFRKDTDKNILGLFSVQEKSSVFTNLGSDQEIIDFVLKELDEIFDGDATKYYKSHVVQNWSNEPYILGSYSDSFEGDANQIKDSILAPVDNKIYFAGEALSNENQSTVHGASESAYQQIEKMLTA